jgi:hypothetical protein
MACRLIYGLSGSYLALTGMTGQFQDERVIPGRALMGCQQVSLFTELPRRHIPGNSVHIKRACEARQGLTPWP